jgi:ribonuclease HI
MHPDTYAGFRLEPKGPTGEWAMATKERADIRAVTAALQFRRWPWVEDCISLVIATNSQYVIDGITTRVVGCLKNEWTNDMGDTVENQDLWKLLLK